MTVTQSSETARDPRVSPEPEREHAPRDGAGRVGVLRAARRNLPLVLGPALLLASAAIIYSSVRAPVYTAETRLTVGRLDISAPGAISGFSQATQSLASSYSRTVDARLIVKPVAAQLGLSIATVNRRVSASPIPESPVFRIEAKGPSEASAVRLANAVSESLVTYVTRLNRSNPDGRRLLKLYKSASLKSEQAKRALERAEAADSRRQTRSSRAREDKATTDVREADLRAETIRNAYQESQRSQSATELVQFVSPAGRATSDRAQILQFLLFIAVVAGLAFGMSLATARAARQARHA